MAMTLTVSEARVLGALIEKEMTTPEYYPLSLNALVNACNQKSNRDPVAGYDEQTVLRAIEGLKQEGLALTLTGREMRVPKYGHRISEIWNLGNRELAVLQVLLLRGPQTVGEIKERAARAHAFDDLDAVESCLKRLMEFAPDPLAARLPRAPGSREARFGHLLCGDLEQEPATAPAGVDRIAAIETEVAGLREEVKQLRQALADFCRQFES